MQVFQSLPMALVNKMAHKYMWQKALKTAVNSIVGLLEDITFAASPVLKCSQYWIFHSQLSVGLRQSKMVWELQYYRHKVECLIYWQNSVSGGWGTRCAKVEPIFFFSDLWTSCGLQVSSRPVYRKLGGRCFNGRTAASKLQIHGIQSVRCCGVKHITKGL